MTGSAAVVDQAIIYILAFSFLLFFLIVFFMIYFVVRYRKKRNPIPVETKGSGLLEWIWIAAALVLVLSMFVYGLTGFAFLRSTPADSLKIRVDARQWSWIFGYPNGKKSPDLVIPSGKNITCELTSADVIHGFYIPAFRIQMDVVPGMVTNVWFNSTQIGSYDLYCAQYCGLKHSLMTAKVYVIESAQFDSWLKGENVQLPGAADKTNMPPGEVLLLDRGCVSCHSLAGGALVGPTLEGLYGSSVRVITNGQPRTITVDDGYIRKSIIDPAADIVDGYGNVMPSGRDILQDNEITEIINYLKNLK
jgi:cytochrome c oxidase subunit II